MVFYQRYKYKQVLKIILAKFTLKIKLFLLALMMLFEGVFEAEVQEEQSWFNNQMQEQFQNGSACI